MKTISLQGKEYAQVSERVKEVHTTNKQVSINTTYEIIWEKWFIIVKAEIKTEKWTFNWHSYWSFAKDKWIEKLESVAVGRALAFAWYLSDWEIASYEEVEDFLDDNQKRNGN